MTDKAKRQSLARQGMLHPRPEDVTDPLFGANDFFDPYDVIQVKYEMLRQVRVDDQPISQSAKAFGFSRPSFYQAQAAFQQNGLPGLVPQKRGPHSGHKLTTEVMEFLNQAQEQEPSLRTDQMVPMVKEKFGVTVHARSIERQFLRQKKR